MPESPKADLHRYLQAARDALLWKLDGLSEYDVRHNAGAGAAGTNDAIDYGPGRTRSWTRKNNAPSTSVGSGAVAASPTTMSTLSHLFSATRVRACAAMDSLRSMPVT
jgi:hypothetical protein